MLGSSERLAWMRGVEADTYKHQAEQLLLRSHYEKQQLHSHLLLQSFFSARLPKGRHFSGSRTQPLSGTCSDSYCQGIISALHKIQAFLAQLYIHVLLPYPWRGERQEVSFLHIMSFMLLNIEL